MRRNCPVCGERYEGDVCPKCHTPAGSLKAHKSRNKKAALDEATADKFLTEDQRAAKELLLKERQKDKKLLIIIIAVAVLAAVFIFYRNGIFGGNYKRPINDYFEAICERDFEKYIGTMPQRMREDYVYERESLGYSEYDYLNELYADLFEEFGDSMTIELEFSGRERPDEEYIQSFESAYLQAYGETINTETVYGVNVTAHFAGEVSQADIELECFVLRLAGRWYMVGCDYK